jgi:hypothetical protein
MSDTPTDLHQSILAKTGIGQQEVQNRALGLNPLVRRLLILVDGKRSGEELAAFVVGHDVCDLLGQLLANGCIEITARAAAAPTAPVVTAPPRTASQPAAVPATSDAGFANLPPADSRSAKEVDMARNFMTNTVNTIFQPNTRLSLLEAIFACKTAEATRRVYPRWLETISTSALGLKRLPEFQEKLFKVL